MLNKPIILSGKLLSATTKRLNLGNGSTWPGHLALKANRHFIRQTLAKSGIQTIFVAGTNGKTTTSAMIAAILEANGKRVLQNISGANLLNGIASSLLLEAGNDGKLHKDYAIFEVDENALPLILKEITPDYIVLLNLFRDQLDRYGEVDSIATKWQDALKSLPASTAVILNADDPQIAYLGEKTAARKYYYGLPGEKKMDTVQEHAVDSLYCPECGAKLTYRSFTFSHLGDWHCPSCGLARPPAELTQSDFYPLPGLYNRYNAHAALLLTKTLGITQTGREDGLKKFTPVFGRQEEIVLKGKKVRIFLSKNPTGFNESLRTIKELKARHILFVLNDRIPDGRDVSWIWDTDIEGILDGSENILVSGDRVYDMGLRLKYAAIGVSLHVLPNLADAIRTGLDMIRPNETLFILPTYSAMLETRKIITGKKIL